MYPRQVLETFSFFAVRAKERHSLHAPATCSVPAGSWVPHWQLRYIAYFLDRTNATCRRQREDGETCPTNPIHPDFANRFRKNVFACIVSNNAGAEARQPSLRTYEYRGRISCCTGRCHDRIFRIQFAVMRPHRHVTMPARGRSIPGIGFDTNLRVAPGHWPLGDNTTYTACEHRSRPGSCRPKVLNGLQGRKVCHSKQLLPGQRCSKACPRPHLVTQVTEKSRVDIPGTLQHDRRMIDAHLQGLPVANCIGLQLLPLELLLADRECG